MFLAIRPKCIKNLGYNARLRRVAQPGSALAWGARGREFESRHADQKINGLHLKRM